MKMELTARDKNLLIFLAVFVIVVGFGYWGIRPLIKSINEIELDKEAAEDLKDINDMKISMLPMLIEENTRLEEDILTVRKNFYPMMTADEIDRHFTEMALDYGLKVYSMDIRTEKDEAETDPYKYAAEPEEESHYEEGYVESQGTTTDIESVDNYAQTGYTDFYEEEDTPATGIYRTVVGLKLQGSREQLQKLIDDLSKSDKNHLVSSYSWSVGTTMTQNEKGEYIPDEVVALDLQTEIYQAKEGD